MCGSALSEPGGMTSVCCQLTKHAWPNDIVIDYVPTHISGNPARKALFFVCAKAEISKKICAGEVDVVHAHMSYKGSFVRKYEVFKICKRHSVPFILHLHGSEFEKFYKESPARIKRDIEFLLEGSNVVICLGESWRLFVSSISPKVNTVVMRNSVAFEGVKPKARNPRRFSISFLGLLIERKGVGELLEAFAAFLGSRPDSNAVLNIAGIGKLESTLKDRVNQLGIEDRVRFLGWIAGEEKKALLAETDVFCLPSHNEGLPISLLEAMAVGIPPVVSDVGSVSEVVTDGIEGCLVEPGKVEQIALAIRRMYDNETFWHRASRACMERIKEEFSEERYFNTFAELYRMVGKEDN